MKKNFKSVIITVITMFMLFSGLTYTAFASGYIVWPGSNSFNQAMVNLGFIGKEVIEQKSKNSQLTIDVNKLTVEVSELEKDNDVLEKDKTNLTNENQELSNSNTTLSGLNTELKEANDDLDSVNSRLGTENSELKTEIENVNNINVGLTADIVGLKTDKETLTSQLNSSNNQYAKLTKELTTEFNNLHAKVMESNGKGKRHDVFAEELNAYSNKYGFGLDFKKGLGQGSTKSELDQATIDMEKILETTEGIIDTNNIEKDLTE